VQNIKTCSFAVNENEKNAVYIVTTILWKFVEVWRIVMMSGSSHNGDYKIKVFWEVTALV
jgi:hypothetical protein